MIPTVRVKIGVHDDSRGGYPLELFDFPGGQRLAPDAGAQPDLLPSAAVDADALLTRFAGAQTQPADLVADGQRLFDAINSTSVGRTLAQLRSAPEPYHTLLDIEPPALRMVPWELMADGIKLLFARTPPIARYIKAPIVDDTSSPWPLRLLVVVGAQDKDVNAFPKLEVDRLREDLLPYRHSIDLEITEGLRPSRDQLQALITRVKPHVFHFIGHAEPSNASGFPSLTIEAATPWWLDVLDVGAILDQAHAHPRFVFLNACRTGDPRQAMQVADAFIAAGARATLTMHGNISGIAAGRFAGDVYQRIWEGKLPDIAVAEARAPLHKAQPPQTFAYPVLSLSTTADDVLPKRTPLSDMPDGPARALQIERCRIFQEVALFSDRSGERRKIHTAFQPIERDAKPSPLVVITGESGWGKSHVVKRSLECLALGGHNVRYVPLGENGPMSFLDVLIEMLNPNPALSAVPIDDRIFFEFKWLVRTILETGVAKPWDGVTRIKERIALKADQHKAEDPIKQIFSAFGEALRKASADRPLLLVLDQFRDNNREMTVDPELDVHQILWPNLFEPLLDNKFPRVSMGLVFWTTDALDLFHIQDYIPQDRWLSIADLDRKAFDDLANELLGYTTNQHLPGIESLTAAIRDRLHAGHVASTAMALCELLRYADEMYRDRAESHRARVKRSQ